MVVNVATDPSTSAGSDLTAWPSGQDIPSVPTVTARGSEALQSSTVVVPVGTDGKINLRNTVGETDAHVTIHGYFSGTATMGGYVPIVPLETANATTLNPRQSRTVSLPYDATLSGAIAVHLRATMSSTASGWLRIGDATDASGNSPATTAYRSGGPTTDDLVVVPNAEGDFVIENRGPEAVQVQLDVAGIFSAGGDGGGFTLSEPDADAWNSADTTEGALAPSEVREIPLNEMEEDTGFAGSAALTVVTSSDAPAGAIAVLDPLDPESIDAAAEPMLSTHGNGASSSIAAVVELTNEGSIRLQNRSSAPINVHVRVQGYFDYVDPEREDTEPADEPDPAELVPLDELDEELAYAIENGEVEAVEPDQDGGVEELDPGTDDGTHPGLASTLQMYSKSAGDPYPRPGKAAFSSYRAVTWSACSNRRPNKQRSKLVRNFNRLKVKNTSGRPQMEGFDLALRCGPPNQTYGYHHLRRPKSGGSHADVFQRYAGFRNWRDFADFGIHWTTSSPTRVTWQTTNNRYCFSGPIYFKNGKKYDKKYMVVIMGKTGRRFYTAFVSRSPYCKGTVLLSNSNR